MSTTQHGLRRTRAAAAVLLLVSLVLVAGSSGASAAPGNDRIGAATAIGALPYRDAVDASGSTAAASDPKDCSDNGSVWYRYTARSSGRLVVDTVGSEYDTVVGVYAGSPGALSRVGCNDDGWEIASVLYFHAQAGTTYYFMVAECCGNGGAGGGPLVLNLRTAPVVAFRNGDVGRVSRLTGSVKVGGMVRCDRSLVGVVDGALRQRIGLATLARGDSQAGIRCSTSRSPWRMTVEPEGSVAFVDRDASLRMRVSLCAAGAPWRCADVDRTRVVHLEYE